MKKNEKKKLVKTQSHKIKKAPSKMIFPRNETRFEHAQNCTEF